MAETATRQEPASSSAEGTPAPAELDRIKGFLGELRRRFLLRDALRWAAFGGAALVTILLILSGVAASFGPANFWRPVTFALAAACVGGTFFAGVWRPLRSLRRHQVARRLVARLRARLGTLGGDIVSAVSRPQ